MSREYAGTWDERQVTGEKKMRRHDKRPTGDCSVCGEAFSIRHDGVIRRHGGMRFRCPGSLQKPAARYEAVVVNSLLKVGADGRVYLPAQDGGWIEVVDGAVKEAALALCGMLAPKP